MASITTQGEFFEPGEVEGAADGTIVVNERCRIQTRGGYRVVTVSGLVLAHYAAGDRMGEAHAMVSLVEQGWARQTEVAAAFGCDERTVRRNQRRFESGGLAALGRRDGYPKGAARLPVSRCRLVNQWKAEGVAKREIARRLGVSEMAVRKLLLRLGWKPGEAEQISLDLGSEDANPNLSGPGSVLEASEADRPDRTTEEPSPGANPNLSGSGRGASPAEPLRVSLDTDPVDRSIDRVLACLGLLDDAAPLFAPATRVPGAGALLAIPALVESGVFEIAAEVYGSIGPAFYGLRTTLVTLLLMALLRIKHPEGLKEHSPRALGRVLGLDRAPPRSRRCAASSPVSLPSAARPTWAGPWPSAAWLPAVTPWVSSTSTATCAPTTASAASRRPIWPACACRCPPPPTTGSTTPRASRCLWSRRRPTGGWSRCCPSCSTRSALWSVTAA